MTNLSRKTIVITGGGSGLGQALAHQFTDRHFTVYIIDRHLSLLKETQAYAPNSIHILEADLTKSIGRASIKRRLKGIIINYLVHNAAIVVPIVPLAAITLKAWRHLHATNVEAPLFLTQALLPQLASKARILHISSDCAHYPLAHWIPYCTSKAALHMLSLCLNKELTSKKIYVSAVDPGMMNTPMQDYICHHTAPFPEKMSLEELQQRQLIFTAYESAAFCLRILLQTDNTTYVRRKWVCEK